MWYCIVMYYKLKRIQQFIGIIFVGYIVLMYISPQIANFALAIFLVGSIPGLILYNIYNDKMYKYSISPLPRIRKAESEASRC